IGQKDSIVTDSTIIPLFYPRLRFEHTLNYGSYRYEFNDLDADSVYYSNNYGINLLSPTDTVILKDIWKELTNDFSIYQFPDAKNSQQFIKAGIEYQWLKGDLKNGSQNYYNLVLHGGYRNRTRNQKWDMVAAGRLYVNGLNAGDYRAYISLQRLISQKIGSLRLGFENINRSPSFLCEQQSNFYLDAPKSFSKENITHLFANVFNPVLKLQLGADYFLVGNYLYFSDFYKPRQEGALFNVVRIQASKKFRLGKNFNWYADIYLQQKAGNADLNLPFFLTRNRIMYEGNLGRKNLNIAFGTEIRYHTPYKADNYSPVLGQFAYQDSIQIQNRPDVNAFLHLRIRSFKAYVRAENLNTFRINNGSIEFKEHNFAAPDYPYPGLVIRLGIYWSFVN
ncbi:MAG TPA: putative porin, partial [Chitinophagaceae bacterium]|nr:putative porin [Chitinophagaceae bacterium]